jgi:hypothetical protein
MTHNLIVRGFDDNVHTQLGEIANQRGVSINSKVKDAVDKWLKEQQLQVLGLLKSMDRIAKKGDLFKCFCGPPSSTSTEPLSKLKWYNGTIEPYYYSGDVQDRKQPFHLQIQSQKNIMKYCRNVMENIASNSNDKQVCCMDFLINDIAKSSFKQALTIEEAYNNSRIPGLMYCTYKTEILLNSEIKEI